jgi:phosphatidylserine synthase
VGLTISVSGAAVALSVLANHTYGDQLLPPAFFPVLLVVLTVLMVSRIRYPELGSVLRSRWLVVAWLALLVVLGLWLSPQLAGLALVFGYVAFGLLRSAYRLAR